jgi:GTPase involved in cell partitioning and DNA repair
LQADHDLNNLIAQYYQPRLIAEAGEPGFGKGMDGHAGKDLIIKVPCGTLVWQLPSAAKTGGNFEDEPSPLHFAAPRNEDDKTLSHVGQSFVKGSTLRFWPRKVRAPRGKSRRRRLPGQKIVDK